MIERCGACAHRVAEHNRLGECCRPGCGCQPECASCGHSEPHTGAGLGVCLSPGCGCDGPINPAHRAVFTSESVLEEAQRLTTEDRNESYGPAHVDYGRTCDLFNAWRGPDVTPMTVEEALVFMACVKLSRERHRRQRDNITDAVGYLALYAQVVGHD